MTAAAIDPRDQALLDLSLAAARVMRPAKSEGGLTPAQQQLHRAFGQSVRLITRRADPLLPRGTPLDLVACAIDQALRLGVPWRDITMLLSRWQLGTVDGEEAA